MGNWIDHDLVDAVADYVTDDVAHATRYRLAHWWFDRWFRERYGLYNATHQRAAGVGIITTILHPHIRHLWIRVEAGAPLSQDWPAAILATVSYTRLRSLTVVQAEYRTRLLPYDAAEALGIGLADVIVHCSAHATTLDLRRVQGLIVNPRLFGRLWKLNISDPPRWQRIALPDGPRSHEHDVRIFADCYQPTYVRHFLSRCRDLRDLELNGCTAAFLFATTTAADDCPPLTRLRVASVDFLPHVNALQDVRARWRRLLEQSALPYQVLVVSMYRWERPYRTLLFPEERAQSLLPWLADEHDREVVKRLRCSLIVEVDETYDLGDDTRSHPAQAEVCQLAAALGAQPLTIRLLSVPNGRFDGYARSVKRLLAERRKLLDHDTSVALDLRELPETVADRIKKSLENIR